MRKLVIKIQSTNNRVCACKFLSTTLKMTTIMKRKSSWFDGSNGNQVSLVSFGKECLCSCSVYNRTLWYWYNPISSKELLSVSVSSFRKNVESRTRTLQWSMRTLQNSGWSSLVIDCNYSPFCLISCKLLADLPPFNELHGWRMCYKQAGYR